MARREREEVKPDDGFSSKLVAVNRITKVVKGGRNMRFRACTEPTSWRRWRVMQWLLRMSPNS